MNKNNNNNNKSPFSGAPGSLQVSGKEEKAIRIRI